MKLPQISDRDRLVVQFVNQFGRLSSGQIYDLVFHDVSRGPCQRSIARLVAAEYLYPIERYRVRGGSVGGSGQNVYALGRNGWWMENRKAGYVQPRPFSMHTFHTLAIADVYIDLVKLDRAGRLQLRGASTEPDCHRTVGRFELTPDLHVAVVTPSRSLEIWVEVDRGTEGRRQIQGKMARYFGAYNYEGQGALAVMPGVVFVAEPIRVRELQWLIEDFGKVPEGLFRVMTKDELMARLCR